MDIIEVKNFLEQKIFLQLITDIKKFGKGQLSAFYVQLADGTQLSVKFYDNVQNVLYAYHVAHGLEQNPELRVPRLYKLKDKYFKYKQYFGLCFYYIEGKEISAVKLNKHYLTEVADAYAVSKKQIVFDTSLRKDKSLDEYIALIKQNYLTATSLSKSLLQRVFFRIALHFARRFVEKIEREHSQKQQIPQKLIHCDITKSNMLFKDGHFQSFIDTDAACYGYIGRDFAEFIISSVLHYPLFKSKRNSIREWYKLIDERYNLTTEEYLYGLDIYFLSRLEARLRQYQNKITFCKLCNFAEFLHLRTVTLKEILNMKKIYHNPLLLEACISFFSLPQDILFFWVY